jgi:hypothetical protein
MSQSDNLSLGSSLWSLKIKSDNRIDKTSVKQTVSLFEQADSLFYVWSDYLIKNH